MELDYFLEYQESEITDQHLLLDPITLFFPCVFLFLYFWLEIDSVQSKVSVHICAKISQW